MKIIRRLIINNIVLFVENVGLKLLRNIIIIYLYLLIFIYVGRLQLKYWLRYLRSTLHFTDALSLSD